ncbi:dienelactone hydrolase family protein [Azospirillum sp. RWY-5-1]|uniref:Dienelactone hydrolase family protein n=1 Tax=Azospirillum oleiclasticum TaxID=2735135 RepID=A0ABX2T8T7_9PROT|nr:dienelactone hydrolase family protein [Azospirillum oleiclasticum]NYZ19100.1 dienelactone hydrolase family protein [Azospirillum oleiclasticum]
MTEVTIQAADGGAFMAYVAKPATLPAPAVVVIQEIFGVNAVMRGIADDLARQGYLAVCPDLFWRIEPGVDITDKTQEEWNKAFALLQKFDVDKGVGDLKSTADWCRQQTECNARVGTVGYCLGGKMAFLMASRSDVDANVSYYGVGLVDLVGEVPNIKKPLLMHVAELDKFVAPEARDTVLEAVAANPKVTAHVYEGMDHAFARKGGDHFDAAASELANGRTADFFREHLS